MNNHIKLDEDEQEIFKTMLIDVEKEDDQIRRSQVKNWKKAEEFWHGVQYLYWNEREQSWISPQTGAAPNLGFSEEEMEELGPFYDYVINIYTAHGQSIIAALSSQLPTLKFLPDDADDDSDKDTAQTYDKLQDLIARHNNAKLLFMRALFFLWVHGFVASYRYIDSNPKYGVYKIPVYENGEVVTNYSCPGCGADLSEVVSQEPEEENEENGGNEEKETEEDEHDLSVNKIDENSENTKTVQCPQCGDIVEPIKNTENVPLKVRDEEKPKSRVRHEIYGPLFVKVPYYAITQEDCGYCVLYLEQSKDQIISSLAIDEKGKLDEELATKIRNSVMVNTDRFTKSEFSYPSGPEIENRGLSTVIQVWFRPSSFFRCEDFKKAEKLRKKFPDGVKVVFVGREKNFVAAYNENLDERWTFGQAGLSTYIHADAWGQPLIPVQELRNQFDNLFVDTFEHGMPSTFADSEVLDFDAYGKFEALPSYMFKAKAPPGKTLAECFYTEQKASVPRESISYKAGLDKDAQFVVGSFPSLYGGPSEGKSRTFAEYNASRQQALQRLQISWMFSCDFYRRDMEQMVRMYAGMMVQDERFVKMDNGNYINIWIKKSQMQGKIGGVESEASDAFPMSLQQKQAFLTKMIELNNPQINSAIYAPENREIMQDVFAMNEFHMPGSNQIYKQCCETNEMMRTEQIILIDPDIDDDMMHITALKNTMVSSIGIEIKKTKPQIWAVWLGHLRMHQQNLMAKTVKPFEGTAPGQPPDTSATSAAGGIE